MNSKTVRGGAMPKAVRKLRNESSIGNTIPMVMVTTSDAEQEIVGYSYKQLSADTRSLVRSLKKTLKTVELTTQSSARSEEQVTQPVIAQQAWTNSAGKQMTAAVLSVSEETVIFLMPNGTELPYALSELSESSRQKIQEEASQ